MLAAVRRGKIQSHCLLRIDRLLCRGASICGLEAASAACHAGRMHTSGTTAAYESTPGEEEEGSSYM